MDALRATKRQEIDKSETLSKDSYGLEAAFNDVHHYDDDGTLTSALLAISADAAKSKQTTLDLMQCNVVIAGSVRRDYLRLFMNALDL